MACFQKGGPWALVAKRHLLQRPADAPQQRPRWHGYGSRPRPRLRELFARIHKPSARKHRELEALMGVALRWLAARNIETVVSCMCSWPDTAPATVAKVSDVSIFWAVAAWHFAVGSKAVSQLLSGAATGGNVPLFTAWKPECFADRLAQHLCIEQAILTIETKSQCKRSEERVPGGLRRREVLDAAVRLAADSEESWRGLSQLMMASPLSILVYGDLLAPDYDANNGRISDVETARRALQFDKPDGEKDTEDAKDWHARWLIFLCRSMTGVVLSPPQVEESLAQARLVEATLKKGVDAPSEKAPPETAKVSIGWRWMRFARPIQLAKPDLKAAIARSCALEAKRREQCLRRLRFLSEFLAVSETDLGDAEVGCGFPRVDQARVAAGFFIARTWDMFIRTLLARQTPLIIAEWQRINAAGFTDQAAKRELIGSENYADGATVPKLAQEIVVQLTQAQFSEIRSIQYSEWSADARHRLLSQNFNQSLLARPDAIDSDNRVPGGSALAALAAAARVTDKEMLRACKRLSSERAALPRPDRFDRPPADYLSLWGSVLAILRPLAPVVVSIEEDLNADTAG